MRLVIYEWCCSGGLTGPDAVAVAGDAAGTCLGLEGRAMFRAAVADALRDGGFAVTALVDESFEIDLPSAARRVVVPRGGEIETLVASSWEADAVLLIAPETADVLAARVAAVRAGGGVVLAPSTAFIRLAADKQATAEALQAAAVPVPRGRSLAAGEPWPADVPRPAVRKARASTGCDGLVVVRPDAEPPPPAAVATRLEEWIPGVPVGVSCLLGPQRVVPVAAVVQRFSMGPVPGYAGGDLVADPDVRQRATRLATRALGALQHHDPRAVHAGWVGVDMILGDRPDGHDDRVLEVNPRMTTSFVGLSTASPASLIRAIVDVAAGRTIDRGRLPDQCRFSLADAALLP